MAGVSTLGNRQCRGRSSPAEVIAARPSAWRPELQEIDELQRAACPGPCARDQTPRPNCVILGRFENPYRLGACMTEADLPKISEELPRYRRGQTNEVVLQLAIDVGFE